MTSPFALLFLAIQQRLSEITTPAPDESPIFKFIEQELMQLEVYETRPKVAWPCGLIDIDDANFQNRSSNTQEGTLTVCIRIGFPPYSSTEMNVPATYKNKALYYYDIEQAVVLTFHGWSPGIVTITPATDDTPEVTANISGIFGHFIRTRAAKEGRTDNYRVRRLYFSLSMDDNSTEVGIVMADVRRHNLTADIVIPT